MARRHTADEDDPAGSGRLTNDNNNYDAAMILTPIIGGQR